MKTEITIYINDIKIPITPVNFEYGISNGEMSQIATISPTTSEIGSVKGLTYVYRDLGEKYINLTFNIRTNDSSWKKHYGSHITTDTDKIDFDKNNDDINNPQDFIDWMLYAHGSGEPLNINITRYTEYTKGKFYTHTLTGTYKVSTTSISSSADRISHYASFSLSLVRYIPPLMEKVKLVRINEDITDVNVESTAVESYEPVQTTNRFRTKLSDDSTSSLIERKTLELEVMQWDPVDEEEEGNVNGYIKMLAEETLTRALSSFGKDTGRLLRSVFISKPTGLYNREDPLSPLKVLGKGTWRAFRRSAEIILNSAHTGIITAAGMVHPALQLGVEASLNLVGALVSKIPLPSVFSEGVDASVALDASAETPLLGDGGIVLSYDTDLGFDPKLHATGFDSETISPAYRILKPGIYKRE